MSHHWPSPDRALAFVRHAICLLIAAAPLSAWPAELTRLVSFDIPAQPLATALIRFSQQADLQVVTSGAQVDGIESPGVTGRLSVSEALQHVLAGTDFIYRVIGDGTITIVNGSASVPSQANAGANGPIRLAQAQPASSATAGATQPARQQVIELEEIIVTGSHIRGSEVSASPVLRFDRQDIDASGFATAEQFVHGLPQNFGGGSTTMTATSIRGGEGFANNIAQGTGVNLRGLGNDATLVLLNGRRLAPVGAGTFVDLSLIPLSAIERIEVLTDGASAIYGSDAVGGVVNLITRKDLDGAETRLRYGTVAAGSHDEQQIGQMFGQHWGTGSVLLSYDYYDRSELSGEDRYPEADDNPNDIVGIIGIVPPEKRHGAVLSATQSLGGVDLYFDGLYAERNTRNEYFLGARQVWESQVEQYSGTLGAIVDWGSSWQADIAAGTSKSDVHRERIFSTQPVALTNTALDVTSFDVKADGTLFQLPAGPVRLAVGGHYRSEGYEARIERSPPVDMSRNVRAVFGELLVPLLGAADQSGGQRLALTLAGRHEEYSDFGSTTDPKVGLVWSGASGLSLRGTYGTSFRAPLFTELDDSVIVPAAFRSNDPGAPGGITPTVIIQGSNSDLGPQRAETFTLGMDFSPTFLPGLQAAVTYFDIDLKDRIAVPVPTVELLGGVFLNNPIYASVITYDPDIAAVNAWYAHPNFRNAAVPVAPADIGAIVDERLVNLGRRREQGVDFSLTYAWDTGLGAFNAQLAGTYLLEFENQVTPAAPFVSSLNTVSFPVDLRLRNRLGWRRGDFGIVAFVNYVDSYQDVRPASRREIASWTTVDLTMDYGTGQRFKGAWLDRIVISLSAQNLFDKDAPFSISLTPNGINFDPTNATPIGRFVALQVRKAW